MIPELGPVILDGWCPELRSPLDDPSVRELAREHDLELERVLARATGEFTSTLRWPAAGGNVLAAPESGDVPLTIRVNYAGGAATYVDGVREGDPPGTQVPGCPDHVELEVSVEVQTDGLALDERFEAVLVIERHIGQIRYRAPLRSVGGSLSLSPPPPQGSKQIVLGPELHYFMQVSEFGTSGRLAVIVHEYTDGLDTTRYAEDALPLVGVGSWPAVSACPAPQLVAPFDVSIGGVSPTRISELVAALEVPFTWADGAETTLALSPRFSTETGCALVDGDLIHWWFDVEVSAVTADGILNGSVPGSAHLVQYSDRVVAVFEMSRSSSRDQLRALLPTTAAASDYDAGYVDFRVTHDFAWPSAQPLGSTGALSVVVAPPAACDREECDVRFWLAEGRIPATAAPPE